MNKLKICVYAISKNEEKFVERWYESMSEADEIYVLDTGSEDKTVEKLKSKGINVTFKKIIPWRFDIARNESLNLVPLDTDICVCTDLDEVFHKGWRKLLEQQWNKETTRAKYRYTWSFDENDNEGTVFWISKIHSRNGYKWINPVHEILKHSDSYYEKEVLVKGIQLDHFPDINKKRTQYLPLLELAVNEDPKNDRNMHYLGREYMYYQKWDECIITLKKHLEMENSNWKDERAASMRYIALSYKNKGDYQKTFSWLLKSIIEAPYLREPWMDMASYQLELNNYIASIYYATEALKIKERSISYINDGDNWGYKPFDILAISYYYLGMYKEAYENGMIALNFSKKNQRLKNNMDYYLEKYKKNNKI